ncbi:MAG: pyridoxamine kinase [Spirochaetaceae bacterium]|nr:pyridoxamine kinase [Spirochaetaceae bacterium]
MINDNVLAIHDICSFSKSSLTVVIPIMETLGIEVSPLPTAILSTQTDGYKNIYFKDLYDSLNEIFQHLKNENCSFSSVYSGFLSNYKQVKQVKKICQYYKEKDESLIIIDPVLGDNNEMYKNINNEHVEAMRDLVSIADYITPNMTEVALLLGIKFQKNYSIDKIKEILINLSKLGSKNSIITSIKLNKNNENIFNASIDSNKNINFYSSSRVDIHYPGTGDLFTSLLASKLIKGNELNESIIFATGIIYDTIKASVDNKRQEKLGISTIEAIKLLK